VEGGVLVLIRFAEFYRGRGLCIERGEAQYVWDCSGRRYLDLHTGFGAAFLGHRNPYVVAELERQLERIMVVHTVFDTPARRHMLEELDGLLPDGLTRIFLLNSGAEAVELALKVAVAATGRGKLVALSRAFHGRTLGALSLTWGPKYRKGLEHILYPRVERLRPEDVSAVDKVIDEETAAVFVEPVIGEGGVIPLSNEFLRSLWSRCREVGALLVVDEIQSGFGRTGVLWAHSRAGVRPDILVAGKAIGGGFPVSLVAFTEEVHGRLWEGLHGSTYGGNPLACSAVAGAARAVKEDDVVEKAARMGRVFLELLADLLDGYRVVRDIRGVGLMIGVELRKPPGRVIKCMQERGVLALKAGATVVRLLPPYLVTEEDAEEAVKVMKECIGSLQ